MTQPTQNKIGVLIKNAESPIYDSLRPSGSTGTPVSGGTAAFAFNAPAGINDGSSIIITTNNKTFLTPEKFNWLGHGAGWLSTSADGTPFGNITVATPLGNQTWEYEDGLGSERRFVATVNGKKYLRSVIRPNGNALPVGCGTINYDLGRILTPSDFTYMFSSGKITVGTGASENASLQLKDERIGAYKNVTSGTTDMDNSIYLKNYTSGHTLDALNPTWESKEFYFAKGLNKKGQAYSQAWLWKQNTPDIADGWNWVQSVQETLGYACVEPYRTSESLYIRDNIRSASVERPRYIKWQGFCGNLQSDHADIEWIKTDMFAQLNGSIFVLADSATLSASTNFHPLIPTAFTSSQNWTLRLWKGMMPDYSNAYIHLLDNKLASLASVKL